MERPFILIDYNTIHRDEFEVRNGHHKVNSIFIVLKGSYMITMNGVNEIMSAGDVMIFSDYAEFERTVLEPLEFIYIKFKINSKCPINISIPYGKIEFKNKKRLQDNTEKYLELLNSNNNNLLFYKEHILEDILYQVYSEHFLDTSENRKVIEDLIVKNAIDYINSNLKNEITIHKLCEQTATNKSTLTFRFKKETGMSPIQYVLNKRIEQAKFLLSNSTYSITEISQRCGFSDVYYFSNTFKKMLKTTPSKYRKQFMEQI